MLNSPIEEIKSRLDIIDIIQGYLRLQKAGVNFKALCPFHNEKTPSFVISPARQIWHCFGCQKGGDIFRFVMEIEGVEFGDALRTLAQRAGVVLQKEDQKLKTERKKLYEICELAAKFFTRQLVENDKIKNYLLSRGLTENSVKEFRLGFAPDTQDGLLKFLVSRGYSKEEIEKAGLALSLSNGFADRFRSRIMFPISDLNGQIIGFGGRIFPPAENTVAKYINTPQTLIYDKSRVLYALDKAKLEIRKKDQCLLVEGYMDTIMAHQIGFENTVATSGTALTLQQLKILKRYTNNLLTAFDMDLAGKNATERGIDLAIQEDFNVNILILPGAKDPADYIKENSRGFEKQVTNAKSIMEFYFSQAFSSFDPSTPKGKKGISKILIPHIKKIPNKIEQAHWIDDLSRKLAVNAESIWEEIRKQPSKSSLDISADDDITSLPNRKQLLTERLLVLLFRYPDVLSAFSTDNLKDNFPHLILKSEIEEFKDPMKEIKYCLQEIKSTFLKDELKKINLAIKQAEVSPAADVNNLINQFHQLTQELSRLFKI